jgi:hemolysin D
MIRVLLVDDQKSIRETLKSILEAAADFDVVGMADNGFDAIELVQQLKPDVVLMDMEMPDIDGAIATKIISQSTLGEQVKVLVVSSYDSSEYVTKSIQAGAKGYLLKGASAEGIRGAVRSVHQGYTQIASSLFEQVVPKSPVAVGTKEPILIETDVTGLALTGFEIKEKTPREALPIGEDIDASKMLIEVFPVKAKSRSRRWRKKLPVTIMMALGLMGSAYWLRQRLRQPPTPVVIAEQLPPPSAAPFNGIVEPAQLEQINATSPGFIQDVKVKVGQPVEIGESLLVIRNSEIARTNPKQSPQTLNLADQQQEVMQQQQSSQQRITNLQQEVNTDKQNIASLRSKIAGSSSTTASNSKSNQSALIQQQQALVKKAQATYQLQNNEYQRKQKIFEVQKKLAEAKGTEIEKIEKFMTEADRARVEMESARSNYDNAQISLQEAKQSPADTPTIESPGVNVQQQLEKEEKLRKTEEQLRQEQLNYKQLNTNLQVLKQQSETDSVPEASTVAPSPPIFVDVIASKSGYVIELLVKDGDQVSIGKKLIRIANNRQLKVAIDFEGQLPPSLQVGKNSTVQVRNGQDVQDFEGKILAITPLAANRKQKVEVGFSASQDFLIGQSATVYFPEQ